MPRDAVQDAPQELDTSPWALRGVTQLAMFALIGWLASPATPAAQVRAPLLVEGTETVFQRVLTRPGDNLFDRPDGAIAQVLWPLQPVYVYQRQGAWLQVGRSLRDGPEGWIREQATTPWLHNIVASFTSRGGRERQIMFEDRSALEDVIQHQSYLEMAERYRMAAETVEGGDNDPAMSEGRVLTIEPPEPVDFERDFYLMPIVDFEEIFHPVTTDRALMMEVASVPLAEAPRDGGVAQLRTGIVFLIDTTQSMQPFIDAVRETVVEVVESVAARPAGDVVSFGLMGFRDEPDGRPGTDYRTKVYSDLRFEDSPERVLGALRDMRAMHASTWGFAEDSVAGLRSAIQDIAWDSEDHDFAGRMVVLITDAPPKNAEDPRAESDLDMAAIRSLADEEGVSVVVIHILSRAGAPTHARAEAAYRNVAGFQQEDVDVYFPVDATDIPSFKEAIARASVKVVEAIESQTVFDDGIRLNSSSRDEDLAQLGLAMRLAYLGRVGGQGAPDILRGWTTDVGLERPDLFALRPRVLVTRSQLSSMTEMMRNILELDTEAITGGNVTNFFDDLRSAVAAMAADPNRLGTEDFNTIGGAIAEFVEYLPFVQQGGVLAIDEYTWNNSPGRRTEVRQRLRGLVDLYEYYYSRDESWVSLYQGQPDNERVFAMPLDDLP